MFKHKNDEYRVPRREKLFRLLTVVTLLVSLALFIQSRQPAPAVPESEFVTLAEIENLTPLAACTPEVIQQAVAAGGDIYLACPAPIYLTETLVITRPTRIIATTELPAVLSGRNALQTVLRVESDARLQLHHVEVIDSRRFGVYVEKDASFKAFECRFAGHGSPTSDGAAVWNKNGYVFMDSCMFEDNRSAESGAALVNWDESSMEVHESTFRHNTAVNGGSSIVNNSGVLLMWNDTFETSGNSPFYLLKGETTIEDSVITHHASTIAIDNRMYSTLTLRNVTLNTMYAPAIANTGIVTLADSTVEGILREVCSGDGTYIDAQRVCG